MQPYEKPPTIIKKCLVCSKAIQTFPHQRDFLEWDSCNIRMNKCWSDKIWMSDDIWLPWLVKCPYCHAMLWLYELETIGEIYPSLSFLMKSREFDNTPFCVHPSLEDYFAYLDKGVSDIGKERYVRLHAWWWGNDKRRIPDVIGAQKNPLKEQEISNLMALVSMLDESKPKDLIRKAEVMRELGRFDEVRVLLTKPMDEELLPPAACIRGLAKRNDPFVCEMLLKKTCKRKPSIRVSDSNFLLLDSNKRPKQYTENKLEVQKDGKVIYDKVTGLLWQQSGSEEFIKYDETKDYIRQLNQEGFVGYNDWRLPTLKEAITLLRPAKTNKDLFIDSLFDNKQRRIWTSDLSSIASGWVVFFNRGNCLRRVVSRLNLGYYVRAVR